MSATRATLTGVSFRVVLDANVLVPAHLRDVLVSLAEAGLFVPLWSPEILDEMLRHLPDRVEDAARAHLVEQMGLAFPDALVVCPDTVTVQIAARVNDKDRHLIATVVHGSADALLTEDRALRVQSANICDVMSVAEFLVYTVDVSPALARAALETMLSGWPETAHLTGEAAWERLTAWMRRQGWTAAVDILEPHDAPGPRR